MQVAIFSSKPYDRRFLNEFNQRYGHELAFFEAALDRTTAPLAHDHQAVCVFVHDRVDKETLRTLKEGRTRLIALRATGYNNVDLAAAQQEKLTVVRVPAYSPHAVAEHTVALLLSLNRKTYRGYNRVREGNFSLDGLMGFDIHGRTVGVIGTGKIGSIVAKIMHGFGCRILAHDRYRNPDCRAIGVEYVELPEIFTQSDIITLHCPLLPETHHIVNAATLAQMKDGVTLLNTSRGALIDTRAVIQALKGGKIGYLGLDVYEEESGLFFEDLSNEVLQDDAFARLLTFPNVLITGHQGFFTKEALENIARTTLQNISQFERDGRCDNEVK